MKIFAILVTHNPGKWLDKCFGSLRNSTIPVNIIVVDNASTDDSLSIIKRDYPEVDIILSKENLGFGRANNRGIRKAYNEGAEYILLLNQDAWVEKNTIELLIQYHKKESNFDIISPIHLDGTGKRVDNNFSNYIIPAQCKNFISDVLLNQVRETLYEIEFTNAACWLLTKKCIETVGGFNPLFYHYGEDNNYLNRLHYHGLKAGLCPAASIFHDRKQENINKFFFEEEIYKRSKLIKCLNPFTPLYIYSEIKIVNKKIFYHLLTLKFHKFFNAIKERRKLKEESYIIKSNLCYSSEKGMAFLQDTIYEAELSSFTLD